MNSFSDPDYQAADNVADTANKAADAVGNTANKAADALAGGDLAATLGKLRDAVEELCSRAPEAAKQAATCAKETATKAGRTVADTVRKHPVQSALVAAAAGMFVYWLMRRNRSTHH